MMMTPPPFTSTDLLVLFIASVLIVIPTGMLLKKTGHNPFWALLVFFPPLAVIGLWVLALRGRSGEA